MLGIERQSSYYGFADPDLARHADFREGSELPVEAEVVGMFRGNAIQAGTMARTSAVVTAGSNQLFDLMVDRFYEHRNSMSTNKIRDELAKEFYSDPEQQKAFKKGWNASAKPGRDIDKADKMWQNAPSGDPAMNAFYDGWELVSEHL